MRRILPLVLLTALATPVVAHADPIDDFVFKGGGHTIAYSLPATSSYPDFELFNFFSETSPATIDGVSGYVVSGDYYLAFPEVSVILNVSSPALGVIYLLGPSGPPFISWSFVPANNSLPYLPFDVVPTFIPGVYNFSSFIPPNGEFPPGPTYTLTITPESATATTPEPSSLALLSTGALALIAFASIRRRTIPSWW
jgi:hypothetical protein